MLKKLRLKFVLINMSIVTAMLMFIFGLIYFMTKSNLETESISLMQTVAENPLALANPEETDQVQLPYFTVQLNPMGEVISTGGGYYDLSDEEYVEEIIDAVFAQSAQTGVLEEYGLRYYRSDLFSRVQNVVFTDLSYETATLQDLMQTCIIIGVLAFFALLAASILLARWAVKPVEQAWERQRKFMADASHELKTPLTVIMTNAELMENPEYDEESRRQFNENILVMSHQMRSLVEKLLEIARLDDDTDSYIFEELDFSELVTEAVLPFEAVYFENGNSFTFEAEEGIRCSASAEHMRRVVEILLDNACKYTRKGGKVAVSLSREGKRTCRLSVFSEGRPMSREECEAVFRRFYRGDSARSRTGSFGLGLSIAQTIVEHHRGSIRAVGEETGNRFIVELPMLTDD